MHQLIASQLPKKVHVPEDQGIFGNQSHWMPKIQQNPQEVSGQLIGSFGGLVAVGIAGEHDGGDLPFGVGKGLAQKLGGISLDENLGLKVQPSGISPVLMAIAGIAIEASRVRSRRRGSWSR
jgi:hypothetical protein